MDINEEQAAIAKRQRIAEMLMAQGQEPIEQQTAGGYVVPISPLAGVAKVAQQLAGAYMGNKADEQLAALKQKRLDDLSAIDFDSPDAASQLMKNGMVAEAIKLRTDKKEASDKIPTGFRSNDDGSIAPMPIAGGGNYMDYQIQLANQKAQIPGYGEPQKLEMALEDQSMQREAMARAEAAAERQQAAFERQQQIDELKIEQEKKQAAAGPKLTEGQAKASVFASQMLSASAAADKTVSDGFDPTNFKNQLDNMMAGGATNLLASTKAQQYKQAQNEWAEAYLRIKTGAAASKEEVALNVKTYFPQLGDSKETIEQKNQARKNAEQSVLYASGPAAADVSARQSNKPVIDIKDPANDTPEVRAAIADDIAKDAAKSGGLTPQEQAELEQLRKRFGR